MNSPKYTRLAQSWAGNVNRAHTTGYGTEISSEKRVLLKDDAVYMKVQAVLWAADENSARRDKVAAMLDELRSVTSWQTDSAEQYRLEAGWLCTNLAQAAAIIDYRDNDLVRFLADVCYPALDWTNGPNWHASFADSRLAIAAYVGDTALWEDAKAYFYRRIAQSNYHSSYDGRQVTPLLNESGSPHVELTKLHWGSAEIPQIHDDFSPIDAEHFVDGTNAERTRDLSHVSMGLGAWMHAARTLFAQGETIEPQAYDRLRAAYAHHGDRVLSYLDTGVIPVPEPNRGDGGDALEQGWFGACRLFGSDTPSPVNSLCGHEAVTGHSAVGANHMVAEAFADGP